MSPLGAETLPGLGVVLGVDVSVVFWVVIRDPDPPLSFAMSKYNFVAASIGVKVLVDELSVASVEVSNNESILGLVHREVCSGSKHLIDVSLVLGRESSELEVGGSTYQS